MLPCIYKMKCLPQGTVLLVLLTLVSSFKVAEEDISPTREATFEDFKILYHKKYDGHVQHIYRRAVYLSNLRLIWKLNQEEQGTAVYGINHLADFTQAEIKARLGVVVDHSHQISFHQNYTNEETYTPKITPDTWNWTSLGAVSSVKNQGSCGSCWAFSIAENVEGQYWMKSKTMVQMSPQQCIDCDTSNFGCSGGWPYNGISYLATHGGMESLSDYPLRKNYSGPCQFDKSKAKAQVLGYMNVTKNETIIKDALYQLGPLSVLMDFTGLTYYKKGVASPLLCSTWPDHALLLVGYGSQKGEDYWLIKNSWGPSWGQSGYLMLLRGKSKCAISEFATTAMLG